ncbi:hypothetical protein ASF24_17640 [Methylobacterium sp. Leaf86]|nr:hypothetical protein ASF24_17640 [Methylobacterium sp. Leaf86]
MVSTLDEHYFNHPLTKLNKKHDGQAVLDNIMFNDEIVTTESEIDFNFVFEDTAEDEYIQ